MDIRRKTCLIVKRGNQYLVGWNYCMGCLNWSFSPWDAWRTRSRDKAKLVSDKCGGTLVLFNPVAAQIKIYEKG